MKLFSGAEFSLRKTVLALAIGLAGALIASWLTFPLPWMLGSMLACTIAAVARAPVGMPMRIRNPMVVILGVLLGSGFTPDMVGRLGDWALSLGLVVGYIAAVGLLVYPYFRRVAGYDPVTAYFCSMPGGLNEMMMIGKEMGGDEKRIVLTHASRIMIAVFLIPVWFRLSESVDMSDRARLGVSITDIPYLDLGILFLCGILGMPLATLLRLPARLLIGPMLLSAAVHLTGVTRSPPPLELVNLSQLVIGVALGCRFAGTPVREVLSILKMSIGATFLMVGLTVVFAILLNELAGTAIPLTVLAYAPGGLAEMSLVALAFGADVAFVATHHVFRISLVVLGAPILFRWSAIARKRKIEDS